MSKPSLWEELVRSSLESLTYRKIVQALKRLEGVKEEAEPFIAIIAARPTLDPSEQDTLRLRSQRYC